MRPLRTLGGGNALGPFVAISRLCWLFVRGDVWFGAPARGSRFDVGADRLNFTGLIHLREGCCEKFNDEKIALFFPAETVPSQYYEGL
jgi:hypothetical protein